MSIPLSVLGGDSVGAAPAISVATNVAEQISSAEAAQQQALLGALGVGTITDTSA